MVERGKRSGLRPFVPVHTFCYEDSRATPLKNGRIQNGNEQNWQPFSKTLYRLSVTKKPLSVTKKLLSVIKKRGQF